MVVILNFTTLLEFLNASLVMLLVTLAMALMTICALFAILDFTFMKQHV
jgi:hypothetical protein